MSVGKLRAGACQAKGEWISAASRLALYIRDGFMCLYCGTFLHTYAPSHVTLDHLKPRSAGGTNKPANLVTACRSCNSARGAKPWVVYASQAARIRISNARRRVPNRELARAILKGEAGDPRLEARDLEAQPEVTSVNVAQTGEA